MGPLKAVSSSSKANWAHLKSVGLIDTLMVRLMYSLVKVIHGIVGLM